jgi:hypothetical protein
MPSWWWCGVEKLTALASGVVGVLADGRVDSRLQYVMTRASSADFLAQVPSAGKLGNYFCGRGCAIFEIFGFFSQNSGAEKCGFLFFSELFEEKKRLPCTL